MCFSYDSKKTIYISCCFIIHSVEKIWLIKIEKYLRWCYLFKEKNRLRKSLSLFHSPVLCCVVRFCSEDLHPVPLLGGAGGHAGCSRAARCAELLRVQWGSGASGVEERRYVPKPSSRRPSPPAPGRLSPHQHRGALQTQQTWWGRLSVCSDHRKPGHHQQPHSPTHRSR